VGGRSEFASVLFYTFAAQVRVGYARGLAREGANQFYFILGN
jgi:hypothetical protein